MIKCCFENLNISSYLGKLLYNKDIDKLDASPHAVWQHFNDETTIRCTPWLSYDCISFHVRGERMADDKQIIVQPFTIQQLFISASKFHPSYLKLEFNSG